MSFTTTERGASLSFLDEHLGITGSFVRTTELRHRTRRTFSNQNDFRNVTSCPASLSPEKLQTTLLSILLREDLWFADEICRRWNDPLIFIVYLKQTESETTAIHAISVKMKADCPQGQLLFVIEDDDGDDARAEMDQFPINLLRNLALEKVETTHVIWTNTHFLPSQELAVEIQKALDTRRRAASSGQRDALVVPTFQMEAFGGEQNELLDSVPLDFEGLQACIHASNCSVLQQKQNPQTHSSSKVQEWLKMEWYEEEDTILGANVVAGIKRVPCVDSFAYQPTVVIPWCPSGEFSPQPVSPFLDERFVLEPNGMNQIQYMEHIRHLGYEFFVVPRGFLVQTWASPTRKHSKSEDKPESSVSNIQQSIWEQFKDEVHERLGHDIRLLLCSIYYKTLVAKQHLDTYTAKESTTTQTEEGGAEVGKPLSKKEALASDTPNELISAQAEEDVARIEASSLGGEVYQSTESLETLVLPNYNSSLLKSVFRMTDLKKNRKIRTFFNQDDFKNVTECPADLSKTQIETTLVTQLSSHRLWLARDICQRWNGPTVMAVYFGDEDEYKKIASDFLEGIQLECSDLELIFVVNDSTEPDLYPINMLRNMVLEGVRTSHVLLHDADFLPSEDLAQEISHALKIRSMARHHLNISRDEPDALVVPAFQKEFLWRSRREIYSKNATELAHLIPRTFDSLLECINTTSCSVFHEKHFPKGHSSTRTHLWLEEKWYDELDIASAESTVRDLTHVKCWDSEFYEPYFVLPWCAPEKSVPERIAPLYDERFVGYGMNKNQYIEHIRHLRYDFLVVPKGFLIHAPHEASNERVAWDRNTNLLRKGNKDLFFQFTDDVHKRYGYDVKLRACWWLEKMEKEQAGK